MASPRFAVYISVPGAATKAGLGIDALTGWSCAAEGLAVWACAVKSEDEWDAISHVAAAKKRQETPVMIRTDVRRKRSSENFLMIVDAKDWRGIVTWGVTRLAVYVPRGEGRVPRRGKKERLASYVSRGERG